MLKTLISKGIHTVSYSRNYANNIKKLDFFVGKQIKAIFINDHKVPYGVKLEDLKDYKYKHYKNVVSEFLNTRTVITGYDHKEVDDLKISEDCFMFFTEVNGDVYLNIVQMRFNKKK